MLDYWQLILPLVLGAAAVWWLMPTSGGSKPRIVAAFLGIAAFAIIAGRLTPALDDTVARTMTAIFGLSAITAAVLMVTKRNPVYAALWFAIEVTLGSMGAGLDVWNTPLTTIDGTDISGMDIFLCGIALMLFWRTRDRRFWEERAGLPDPAVVRGEKPPTPDPDGLEA